MNTVEDLKWLASVLDVRGTIGVRPAAKDVPKRRRGERKKPCDGCKRADGNAYAVVQISTREGDFAFSRAKKVMCAKGILNVRRPGTLTSDSRVTVCGKRAAAVLRTVLPYMKEPARIALAEEAVALEDAKAQERWFGPKHGDKCDACPACNDDWPKPYEAECQWLGNPEAVVPPSGLEGAPPDLFG